MHHQSQDGETLPAVPGPLGIRGENSKTADAPTPGKMKFSRGGPLVRVQV
jgi:hypothetical protein